MFFYNVTRTSVTMREQITGTGRIELEAEAGDWRPVEACLSTDYLNHYAGPAMVIDLLLADHETPDPALVAILADWRPCDYVTHFERSDLRIAPAAISAWRAWPVHCRARFEIMVDELDALIATLRAEIARLPSRPAPCAEKRRTRLARMKVLFDLQLARAAHALTRTNRLASSDDPRFGMCIWDEVGVA
jgi:hypothetical protein